MILKAVLLTLLVGILGNMSNGLGGYNTIGGPLAVAVMGWFILSQLVGISKRLDQLEQTQTNKDGETE